MSLFKFRWSCFFLLINFHGVVLVHGYKDGLYTTEDKDVLPLTSETFTSKVLQPGLGQTDVVWVVEFYNSWCGHCIHFAPTWKQLAKEMKDWSELVVIAAIDCSQSANVPTCRAQEVHAYPTLKIFPPASVKQGKVETIINHQISSIRADIYNYMLNNSPPSWPRLQPLKNIEDIWQDKKDTHQHVMLIFEDADSPTGLQVILDLHNLTNVLVRRMLKDDVAKYGISKMPSLYKVQPDSTYSMLAVGTKMLLEDRKQFVEIIRTIAETKGSPEVAFTPREVHSPSPELAIHQDESTPTADTIKYSSNVVSMQDLESALHYSLRQEVAIRKLIADEKLQALKKYVGVLLKYFPGSEPILGFLKKVNQMLVELQTNNMTGEDWVASIDKLQDENSYLPQLVRWESCQGSSSRFRGYPCGMWTLFHTLTVSAYSHGLAARGQSNPQEVLASIRGYMEHFFGCQECSKNFLHMAKTIEEEVHYPKDAVMWLWSAHNKANKRLHGDVTEDPEHPKIQFPPEELCSACHSTSTAADGSTKPSWSTEKVLEFLVNFYSEKSIVISKELLQTHKLLRGGVNKNMSVQWGENDWLESKLQDQDKKQVLLLREKRRLNEHVNSDGANYHKDSLVFKAESPGFRLWGLTHVDLTLCVIFYLLSTVIILSLYHHFIVRRRMRPCQNLTS